MYELATFCLHISSALVLGALIGLERQIRQHTAGLRTNTLVCVGAALFVSISGMVKDNADPTRITSYVVSGVGFLGGGVILREGLSVRGLATAATLWCSAAVGCLAGFGFLWQAVVGTAAILLIHLGLRPLARIIDAKTQGMAGDVEVSYRFRVTCPTDQAGVIRAILMRHVNSKPGMAIHGIATQDASSPDKTVIVVQIYSSERNDKSLNDIVQRISIEPCISEASWDRAQTS